MNAIEAAFVVAGAVAGIITFILYYQLQAARIEARNWRYATPAEIDAFAEASALPDIVDPICGLDHILATGTTEQMADWLGDNAAMIRSALAERARKAVG